MSTRYNLKRKTEKWTTSPGFLDEQDGKFSIIFANEFSIFQKPRLISVRLLQSASACAIAFHIHGNSFKIVLRSKKQTHMPRGVYDIRSSVANAVFLANINPPIPFLYCFLIFKSHLKDKSIRSSLFIECFVRPLVSSGVDSRYILTLRFPELKRLSFSSSRCISTIAAPFDTSSPSKGMLFSR
jgi:hypothetical protein